MHVWHRAAGEKARPMWPTCFGGGFATTREAVHQVPRARCELFLFFLFFGGTRLGLFKSARATVAPCR